MKTLFLIHHSHTDIGYTNRQETIRRYHVGFIRQALAILEQRGLDSGFRWQCEGFWGVEQFLGEASPEEETRFIEAVHADAVGLSANYANFSEILNQNALQSITARAVEYSRGIGYDLTSAMTADINGFGWGFCKALHSNGITNLFTCIHTHHGMFPLKRHMPFWWTGPDDSRVLVWNGEHYHFGNELGLAPDAVSSYLNKDECDAYTVYHEPWKVAELRIPRLFEQLDKDNYPNDFLPVMISGLRTDNGPPSVAILDQVNRWNDAHGDEIRVEMTTLDRFFDRLRAESIEIPTYHGDWPDWWTDGVASMPDTTALFREAQRTWQMVKGLRNKTETCSTERELIDNLALYAEHTFGHAASIVEPFDPMVNALIARKQSYAAQADELAQSLLLDELIRRGMATLAPGLPFQYRVVNPHPYRCTGTAQLRIEHHEYYENHVYRGVQVVEESTGDVLPTGTHATPITTTLLVPLTLEPGEERTLRIEPLMARELIPDKGRPELASRTIEEKSGTFETDSFRIEWRKPDGITAWIDKATGQDLLREDRDHHAFMPVYSRTPMAGPDESWSARGAMDLSRSGKDAEWSVGKVIAIRERCSGTAPQDPVVDQRADQSTPMYRRLEFDIEIDACDQCTLVLESVEGLPQVDVSFNVNKQNRWEPENLYLSLPFGSTAQDTVWLDKAGEAVRARVDQLPNTLIDFYSILNGFVVENGESFIAIAMKDTPLLQLGPLPYQEDRVLHDPDQSYPDKALPYAWLMTNYWETNFAAGLGGFYQFRFSVSSAAPDQIKQSLQQLSMMNTGLLTYRLSDSTT